MGVLADWVRNIILMVAAVSFVEILLPGGRMEKYLKFVLALILLAALIHPLSNLGKAEISAFTGSSYTSQGQLKEEDPAEIFLQEVQTQQVAEVYKSRLAQHIKDLLAAEFPGIEAVSADIYISSGDWGALSEIQEIRVHISGSGYEIPVRKFLSQQLGIPQRKIQVDGGFHEE